MMPRLSSEQPWQRPVILRVKISGQVEVELKLECRRESWLGKRRSIADVPPGNRDHGAGPKSVENFS